MTHFKNLGGKKKAQLKYVYWSGSWQMWAGVLQNGFPIMEIAI